MTAWDELKVILVRLREEQPGVLLGYPTLELDPGRVPPVPPFGIRFVPWAAATAAELHRQFGDDVRADGRGAALPAWRSAASPAGNHPAPWPARLPGNHC